MRAPSPIILLCGGPIDVKTLKPASLREAYTLIYGRPPLKAYTTITPEECKIFSPDGKYQDWLSFESEFAQIVDLIVLFSESYGSVAELGAFAMVEEIALRLLVVMDDKNYGESSFIKLGPVRRLVGQYGNSAVCVLNRQDLNITSIANVADLNLDNFAKILIAAIETRKKDYKERTTFNAERPGHLIKLIVGLIQHYGALTETEIEVLLFAMDLKIKPNKISDYLLCAANASWVIKDKRGVEEYYCAKPNTVPAVEYKLRKDIPFEDKDRWRARVSEYWRNEEPIRFDCIQSALRSAL
ncbi:retron St85 family effector protein [Rhizobium leguminosarum]|uniref:Uncharacterized protein n=1 Tax=Rhizobium leguminosarum TaxID=384 RepID=A0A7K3VGC5_RHILE|nr:retron St85 family effector protein [Rhizobium leguminosarum]NEK16200.1 hypothetical protein [Rhizobium leguminosarum]